MYGRKPNLINDYEIKEKACPVQLQVITFFNAEHIATYINLALKGHTLPAKSCNSCLPVPAHSLFSTALLGGGRHSKCCSPGT